MRFSQKTLFPSYLPMRVRHWQIHGRNYRGETSNTDRIQAFLGMDRHRGGKRCHHSCAVARGVTLQGTVHPSSLAKGQVLIFLCSCVGVGKVKESVRNENKVKMLMRSDNGFLLGQCTAHTAPESVQEQGCYISFVLLLIYIPEDY